MVFITYFYNGIMFMQNRSILEVMERKSNSQSSLFVLNPRLPIIEINLILNLLIHIRELDLT